MKIMNCILGAALLTTAGARPATASTNKFYPANRPPLRQTAYVALPLGAVKPAGWLKDQLTIQANGLTGHLDEFWPDLLNSAWKGKDGEGWERGPYYLDGLVPLAYLLDDARLKAMAQRYLDWTLASGKENGWFGPEKNKDRWPLAVAMKVLTQYHEATNDPRSFPCSRIILLTSRIHRPIGPTKNGAACGRWRIRSPRTGFTIAPAIRTS